MKKVGIAVAVLALIVLAAIATLQEARRGAPPESTAAAATIPPDRPPLTADEERYAHDLWKVHDQVRTQAVRMSFVGLSFIMGDIPRSEVAIRIAPVTKAFHAAASDAAALTPPESLRATHSEYLKAVRDYEAASIEMAKVGKGAAEERLLGAQASTARSATTLLKVGEMLWPGEHKPN